MLKVNCDKCGNELNEPGALVFSPPIFGDFDCAEVDKRHICADCWRGLEEWMFS